MSETLRTTGADLSRSAAAGVAAHGSVLTATGWARAGADKGVASTVRFTETTATGIAGVLTTSGVQS